MLISVSYDKDKWSIDENIAMIYPEFRNVIQDKNLGITAMAYVALGCDTSSDNPIGSYFQKEEERLDEAARCVCGENDLIPSHPKVHVAIDRYSKLCNTPYARGRTDLNTALKNVGDYLKTEGLGLTKENIGAYVSAMKTLPDVLLAIKKLDEKHSEETNDQPKVRVKADKQLGLKARRQL